MSLRDQPYLPLYIQDFMTDEKLTECSAEATGVYIRIMCLLHKSENYGKILLKQKSKQNNKQEINFALQLAKHLPYELVVVERCLIELIHEGVLQIEGEFLFQKRMVRDNEISESRSKSGSKGGNVTQIKGRFFAKANDEANSEYENEYENEIVLNKKEREKLPKIINGFNAFPLPEHFNGLPDVKNGAAIQLISITKNIKVSKEDVDSMWDVFKIQNLTGQKFYSNENDVFSHFINWIKIQKFDKNGTGTTKSTGNNKQAGLEALLEKGKQQFDALRKKDSGT